MSASWTDSVVRAILPNGLTLLVQRDSSVPVVAVVTYVKAGYFDEPDEWVGIAHVLEHMFFKGTPERGPGALARDTQRLGGYLNAGTIYDKTVYYAVVPSVNDGLARAVDLQADALMHAALDPDELSRELEVIIQEAKRKLDNPGAVTQETLYELLFQVHRMRRWRIGTEAGLRTLTAADVRAYYESRYTPGRTIVALTGDLDPDAALALGERAYGQWSRPTVPIDRGPTEPAERRAELRILRGDIEKPLVAVGWRTVDAHHPDAPALDVAAGVLGAGRASWLGSTIRVPGLGSGVHAGHYTPGDVGVFDASLTSSEPHVGEALRRCGAVPDLLARQGPDDGQIARVRALLGTYWSRRLESADGRATLLAEFETLGGYELAETHRAALEAVTADDVQRVAAEWLTPDAACAVTYAPEPVADLLADEPWPPHGSVSVPAALATPTSPPSVEFAAAEERAYGDVRVLRWPGTDLIVRRRPGTNLVALGVHVLGLPGCETASNAGISRLLFRAALRGAAGMTADALAAAAESLGGPVGVSADVDRAGVTLSVRADAARAGAHLLRSIVERATLTQQDVVREAALQADAAARTRDDMFAYPIEAALRTGFDGDAYGLPALGDPDVVRQMDAAMLRAWHDRVLGSRLLVVAAGDLEIDQLIEAGAVFADWPAAEPGEHGAVPPWTAARADERRTKAQTALAMAFPGAAAGTDSRYAHAVLSALLSGLAGRLFEELRERRALGYTVYASPWLRYRAGAVLTYIATSPEREDEARSAMLEVLGSVADGPLPDDELERAATYAAGLVAIRRQHVRSVAGELALAWHQGWLDRFAEEEDRRRQVTADELRHLARDTFDPSTRAEYVVRGSGKGR